MQLSLFEVELHDSEAAEEFRARLRSLIDPDDDQVRLPERCVVAAVDRDGTPTCRIRRSGCGPATRR